MELLIFLQLPRPIPSHPNLKAIAVSSEEFLHTLCPVTGLGWTESDLQPPPYSLQELFITAQPHEQCELDVNMKLTHGQFCTLGGETTGFDTVRLRNIKHLIYSSSLAVLLNYSHF